NGPGIAPALRRQDLIRSQNGSRRAASTAPASTSPCPFRYLVAECTTRSAPNSNGRVSTGVATVLSTATRTPDACARSQTAARSVISHIGLAGFPPRAAGSGRAGWPRPPRPGRRRLLVVRRQVDHRGQAAGDRVGLAQALRRQ